MSGHRSVTEPAVKSLPRIEVIPATAEQEPILANLFQLYAHDFSEILDLPLQEDGRFGGYKDLPLYWREAGRHPFLVWVDGKLAGFVLLKKGSEFSGNKNVWDMAEFFVIRAYRRRGVATQVAHEVWRRLPGAWEVRVMEANVSAKRFWEGAISGFVGDAVPAARMHKDGEGWDVFSFDSKR
jgi:predicted acetyltransferase